MSSSLNTGATETREKLSFCRICMGHCGVVVTVDANDQLLDIRGDHDDEQTKGFACFKGLKATEAHQSPDRILKPLKKMPNGQFEPIALQQALDEIAEKMSAIIHKHGPEAIGGYKGNGAGFNSACAYMLNSFLKAAGSPKVFSSVTIDQSSKAVSYGRLGVWPGGKTPFSRSDVYMIVGGNPLVSVVTSGFDTRNPVKRLKDAKARGMKLIVIDPRDTETANFADVFLQPLPGEDCTIIAGLIHIILEREWHDKAFCEEHADDVNALRDAVSAFTPERVAKQAGVSAERLLEVAEVFAKDNSTGPAVSATGPDMAIHANLAEHLIGSLNVICGRFVREGDVVDNPGAILPRRPRLAQVIPAPRWWEQGYQSRVGDFGMLDGELPSGTLAEEILQAGEGQVRGFIAHGGNPVSAVPDQLKIVRAMESLELLVTIDPFMSVTAQLSDYILPPTMPYERADLPLYMYEYLVSPEPYTRHTEAVSKPPEGAEVCDEAYYFWALAKRMGLTLEHQGKPLDMQTPPSTDFLLSRIVESSEIDYEQLKAAERGLMAEGEIQRILPADPNISARFSLLPEDVAEELKHVQQLWGEMDAITAVFPLRMSARRLRDALNSACRDLPSVKKRTPANYAYCCSVTLEKYGIEDGDPVLVESEHGAIEVQAKIDETMRENVVSVAHGYGGLPDQKDYKRYGASTNLLISTDRYVEAINAMPRMTGIPIRISKAQ